ncbi:MAG TPA: GH1 family beta-glucosidase [Actinoplanes sp.]|nr:GH1 family beta-glucosidase [Actinoplanes sp.]
MTEAVLEQREDRLAFPPDFWWGASTAAYQIEGSTADGGRTASIWDTFCATPGAVAGGDTGLVATDHYRRYAEDVAIMAEMGLRGYRFSVSWPRVQPGGRGRLNPAGVAFYDRLLDALCEHGIRPVVTLYHWDLPQELEDNGGWTNRTTAERFAEYAYQMADRLGDRVALWNTLNEPWCSAFLGYASGVHAPGRSDPVEALTAAHHLLLAHGLGTRAVRAAYPGVPVSVVLNLSPVRGVSVQPADLEAVRRIDGLLNRMFLDPVLRGRYPRDVQADTAHLTDWSFVRADDLDVTASPIDVLGINYYCPMLVSGGHPNPDPAATAAWPGCPDVTFHPMPGPVTDMNWPVDSGGLTSLLLRLTREYGNLPLFVAENGAAYPDQLGPDGTVHDPERIDFLYAHIRAAHEALSQGVDLRGYFVWSLLDNFEWAQGYAKRFGLVHVDYATQRRTWKDSALWYRSVIHRGSIPAEHPARYR